MEGSRPLVFFTHTKIFKVLLPLSVPLRAVSWSVSGFRPWEDIIRGGSGIQAHGVENYGIGAGRSGAHHNGRLVRKQVQRIQQFP